MTTLLAKSFNAVLLIGPAQRSVSAHFFADALVVDSGAPSGSDVQVAASDIVVSVGGFEQPALYMNWLGGDGAQCSLTPASDADLQALLASAPASLQPQLQQWRQRGQNTRQIWRWISGLLVACLLLTLLAWWSYPRLTGWLVEQIPIPLEEKLGTLALAQLRAQGELIDSGPAQQAVQRIGARLTKGSAYHYQWLVKRDKTVNAFAAPGGIIVVHSALLEQTANPDELAAVLAHEVQHVEQRHALKQMASSLGLAAVLGVTIGDVSGAAAAIAQQLGSTYFSRDKEEEADRLGFETLLRAGISPDGMVPFFRKLDRAAGDITVPAWVSSHPATRERIAKLEALIAAQPCPACRPLDGGPDWAATMRGLGPASPAVTVP